METFKMSSSLGYYILFITFFRRYKPNMDFNGWKTMLEVREKFRIDGVDRIFEV